MEAVAVVGGGGKEKVAKVCEGGGGVAQAFAVEGEVHRKEDITRVDAVVEVDGREEEGMLYVCCVCVCVGVAKPERAERGKASRVRRGIAYQERSLSLSKSRMSRKKDDGGSLGRGGVVDVLLF